MLQNKGKMQGYLAIILAGLLVLSQAQTQTMLHNADKFTAQLPVDIRCKMGNANKLSCGIHFQDQCAEKWKFPNPCTPDNIARNLTMFPHPKANNKFLMCGDFGKLYVVLCPRYEVFHKGCRQCVAQGSKLTPACEVHDMPLSPPSPNPCTATAIAQGNLFFPFPGDLGKYIHCDAWGKAWEMICTPGEVWDHYKVACVNPALMNPCVQSFRVKDHKFKHPCDPKMFIMCGPEFMPYEDTCPPGNFFSETNKRCESASFYRVLPKNICGLYSFRFRPYTPSAFKTANNQQLVTDLQGQAGIGGAGMKVGSEMKAIVNQWQEAMKPTSLGAGTASGNAAAFASSGGFDVIKTGAASNALDTGNVLSTGTIDHSITVTAGGNIDPLDPSQAGFFDTGVNDINFGTSSGGTSNVAGGNLDPLGQSQAGFFDTGVKDIKFGTSSGGTANVAGNQVAMFDTASSTSTMTDTTNFFNNQGPVAGDLMAGFADLVPSSSTLGSPNTASLTVVGDFSTSQGNVAPGIVDSAQAMVDSHMGGLFGSDLTGTTGTSSGAAPGGSIDPASGAYVDTQQVGIDTSLTANIMSANPTSNTIVGSFNSVYPDVSVSSTGNTGVSGSMSDMSINMAGSGGAVDTSLVPHETGAGTLPGIEALAKTVINIMEPTASIPGVEFASSHISDPIVQAAAFSSTSGNLNVLGGQASAVDTGSMIGSSGLTGGLNSMQTVADISSGMTSASHGTSSFVDLTGTSGSAGTAMTGAMDTGMETFGADGIYTDLGGTGSSSGAGGGAADMTFVAGSASSSMSGSMDPGMGSAQGDVFYPDLGGTGSNSGAGGGAADMTFGAGSASTSMSGSMDPGMGSAQGDIIYKESVGTGGSSGGGGADMHFGAGSASKSMSSSMDAGLGSTQGEVFYPDLGGTGSSSGAGGGAADMTFGAGSASTSMSGSMDPGMGSAQGDIIYKESVGTGGSSGGGGADMHFGAGSASKSMSSSMDAGLGSTQGEVFYPDLGGTGSSSGAGGGAADMTFGAGSASTSMSGSKDPGMGSAQGDIIYKDSVGTGGSSGGGGANMHFGAGSASKSMSSSMDAGLGLTHGEVFYPDLGGTGSSSGAGGGSSDMTFVAGSASSSMSGNMDPGMGSAQGDIIYKDSVGTGGSSGSGGSTSKSMSSSMDAGLGSTQGEVFYQDLGGTGSSSGAGGGAADMTFGAGSASTSMSGSMDPGMGSAQGDIIYKESVGTGGSSGGGGADMHFGAGSASKSMPSSMDAGLGSTKGEVFYPDLGGTGSSSGAGGGAADMTFGAGSASTSMSGSMDPGMGSALGEVFYPDLASTGSSFGAGGGAADMTFGAGSASTSMSGSMDPGMGSAQGDIIYKDSVGTGGSSGGGGADMHFGAGSASKSMSSSMDVGVGSTQGEIIYTDLGGTGSNSVGVDTGMQTGASGKIYTGPGSGTGAIGSMVNHGAEGTTYLKTDGTLVTDSFGLSTANTAGSQVGASFDAAYAGTGGGSQGAASFDAAYAGKGGGKRGAAVHVVNSMASKGSKAGGMLDPALLGEYEYFDTPNTMPCTTATWARNLKYFKMLGNPQSFIVCDGAHTMHVMRCNAGLIFDVSTKSCELPLNI